MPSESDHSRHRNAFTADFLNRLDESGEPDGAHEADVTGPWTIQPVSYRGSAGFALLREWESLEAGDAPYAVFRRRETALLAAAVLPATGRELLLRLDTEPDADGFPLLACPAAGAARAAPAGIAADPAGHLRDFDEGLAGALHVAAALVRSPTALARLLEAAGLVALEQAGRILDRRIH
jgi:hypothetical protein